MKLHLTTAENHNLITAYSESYIEINKQRYSQNLIVMPETIILDWNAENVHTLNNDHFQQIIKLKPEVVLLGTGKTHLFLHPKNHQILTESGIAIECMTTAAACRTYNILMSEGRLVAAALIL
ncbi:Mth938-like domain-containing protein [Methylotenera sp. L2L1]|uniref:Mth938-like domain-containing protein n=1 Tax=Methylotenera sp. L2L1 TaxID=1502770 RepID=UPI00055CE482|nr:Mth938-like domain-containing protein [Methylotenera sp. L2L1]